MQKKKKKKQQQQQQLLYFMDKFELNSQFNENVTKTRFQLDHI
jgi:hypothetical protein